MRFSSARELARLCAAALLLPVAVVRAQCCPNNCANQGFIHGTCRTSDCQCLCDFGFKAGDCSERTCPMDAAWTPLIIDGRYTTNEEIMLGKSGHHIDIQGTDKAHVIAECSNRGHCDRTTGVCVCMQGFSGLGCQRMDCPGDCNGNGECRDIRHHALRKDPGTGRIHTYHDVWDFNKIRGCECDYGFFGPGCTQRHCPFGDDPLTGRGNDIDLVAGGDPANEQFNEVQTIYCRAGGGKFTLAFRGFMSEYFMYSDSAELFNIRLARIQTVTGDFAITGVSATYEGKNSRACLENGNLITIEFTQQFGDLPLLVLNKDFMEDAAGNTVASGNADIEMYVAEAIKGTKEEEYCSARGICDVLTGVCTCSLDYETSDGDAGLGNEAHNRGDCGVPTAEVVACPGEIACSGHGVCTGNPKFRCMCSDGWQGSECSEMQCPKGPAWWDFPIADGRAHSLLECSGKGTCDRSKGDCFCESGFQGSACERIMCPGLNGEPCSGHGACMSMRHLVEAATMNGDARDWTYGATPNNRFTWDREAMLGCVCDEGFEGYNCELRSCPWGDDPRTYSQPDERQTLNCTLLDGGFYLTFRQHTTKYIPHDASKELLQKSIEDLPSVGKVDVKYTREEWCDSVADCRLNTTIHNAMATLCDPSDQHPWVYDMYEAYQMHNNFTKGNIAKITFFTEHGDLPRMVSRIDARRTRTKGTDMMVKVEADGEGLSQRGTKEHLECSGRGTCDYTTGICRCFDGYASSNGRGDHGDLRDCGHTLRNFEVGDGAGR